MTSNSRGFRDALGHFATGVAVISAYNSEGEAYGLTINSFASVSLEPPLILWSLDKASDRFKPLMKAERFAVNILGQDAKDLSRRLSQKGKSVLHDTEVTKGKHKLPVLSAAIAHFECESHEHIDAGDHVIFLSRVIAFAHQDHEDPLLYFRGAYRTLGE